MFYRTFSTFFLAALCFGCSSAHPCHRPPRPSSTEPTTTSTADASTVTIASGFGFTAEQIKTLLPDTATCDSSLASCRTAEQAAPLINASFQKFGFNTPGEQAAIFSLMAFESGNFKYDVNLSGRPGQGTRNMMMFNYVLEYALEFNPDAVHAIRPDLTTSSTPNDVPDDEQKNAIRATVLGDELSFGSGSWFLREKCDGSVAQALQAGNQDGFYKYMGPDCVNAGGDPARLTLYQATLAALSQ